MTETEHLLEAVVETGVSGAVVLADGRGDRVEAAAGIADATTGEPLTPAHRFRIGSATKIFVAPLALRLVEEGSTWTETPPRSPRASRSANS